MREDMKSLIGWHAEHCPERILVRLVTDFGDIVLSLFLKEAPLSSNGFLSEIDRGTYVGGTFWRIVHPENDCGSPPISVIQASVRSEHQPQVVTHEPTSRTGLSHRHGTISLARSEEFGGTSSSFFLCIGDQPGLDEGGGRTNDGRGFAAFGQIIEGMEVAQEIHAGTTQDIAPHPYLSGQIRAEPVFIRNAFREPNVS